MSGPKPPPAEPGRARRLGIRGTFLKLDAPLSMSAHTLRHLLSLALAAAALSACGADPLDAVDPIELDEPFPIATSGEEARSIILISLDTLRADHLSAYGYERPTSPELEDFASGATLYSRCQATAPWTLPSHASMFTGLYPFEHGARTYPREKLESAREFNNTIPLPESHVTLAEVLRECGYTTAAVTANEGFLTEKYGLSQGFDYWDNEDARAWGINRRVFQWLHDHDKEEPFFLFINYMDTHRPYNNKKRPDIPHHEKPNLPQLSSAILGEKEYDKARVQVLHDVYDTAVANLDEHLGKLFDRLQKLGLFDDALIVVTSDHREFLGEHELMDHAKDVYQGATHVPLIVKAPRQTEGRVDDEWISLVHIPELVLAHTRDCDSAALFARQRDAVVSELFGPRPRQKEGIWRFRRVRRAVMHENFKYVDSSDGEIELYDLGADPGEQSNLLDARPGVARQLGDLLDGHFGDIQVPDDLNFVEMTAEDLETMKHLGYAGGGDEDEDSSED